MISYLCRLLPAKSLSPHGPTGPQGPHGLLDPRDHMGFLVLERGEEDVVTDNYITFFKGDGTQPDLIVSHCDLSNRNKHDFGLVIKKITISNGCCPDFRLRLLSHYYRILDTLLMASGQIDL